MLLLIGSDGKTVESAVAQRFGHASYFILFDTATNTVTAVENIDERHDHMNLYEFVRKGIDAFIVGNIGPFAFTIVNTARSKVFLARRMSVREAVEKFLSGSLPVLTAPTAKHSIGHTHTEHDHGSSAHQ